MASVLVLCGGLATAASESRAPAVGTVTPSRLETRRGVIEIGRASWYALHDRHTANGERFDARAFTAAHHHHPFGTLLHVTNLANGKSVVVRVNDRGPHIRGRLLDVSRAAANALGFKKRGLVKVQVLPLR